MAGARGVLLRGEPCFALEVERRAGRRQLAQDGGVPVERREDERGLAVRVATVDGRALGEEHLVRVGLKGSIMVRARARAGPLARSTWFGLG